MRFAALATLAFALDAAAAPLPLDVEDVTLPNGLRVVLHPDRSAPAVGLALFFDVGARDEAAGQEGWTRLVERLVRGGEARASGASSDATVLVEEVPAGALEEALRREAARMSALPVDAATLDALRAGQAAPEPRLLALERARALAFPGPPASSPSAGGRPGATPESLRAFFERRYVPSSALLAIAGSFEPRQAMAWIERTLGALPKRAPSPTEPRAPAPGGERYQHVRAAGVGAPVTAMVWRVPSAPAADRTALDLLAAALGGGEAAELRARVAGDGGPARSVEVAVEGDVRRGASLLALVATAAPGHRAVEVRARLDEELARIRRDGLAAPQLERARQELRARLLASLSTPVGAALRLGETALGDGDPRRLRGEPDRIDAVTAEEVARAAATILDPANRVVVDLDAAPGG